MTQGYDQAIAVVTSQVNEAILDVVGTKCAIRFLNVACGTEWLSAVAVKWEAVVTAIIEGASKYSTDSGVEIPASVMLSVAYKA